MPARACPGSKTKVDVETGPAVVAAMVTAAVTVVRAAVPVMAVVAPADTAVVVAVPRIGVVTNHVGHGTTSFPIAERAA